MFDRFIRLARARKALQDERFEDALRLAADPLIHSDRRAGECRSAAAGRILARARARVAERDPVAARRDLQRLQEAPVGAVPTAELEALSGAVATLEQELGTELDLARRAIEEARRRLGEGDVATAFAALAGAPGPHFRIEREQLQSQAEERRRLAADLLAEADARLRAGDPDAAMERHARALALDRDVPDAGGLRTRLGAEVASKWRQRIEARLASGDLEGALTAFRTDRTLPEPLRAPEALAPVASRLASAALAACRTAGSIEAALPIARAVRAAELPTGEPLAGLVDALLAAGSFGGATEAGATLSAAAAAAAAPSLAAEAETRRLRDRSHQDRVVAAQAHLAAGELEAARDLLVGVLGEQPLHPGARREIDVVERGLAERDQRLELARAAARQGRLVEATALATGLAGAGAACPAAARLLGEVQRQRQVVDRGLDEVRAALHGKAASSLGGVEHCLRRLEELGKVQTDHTELQALTLAVGAEVEALRALDRAGQALERRALEEFAVDFDTVLAARPKFLSVDRLDARLLQLLDGLSRHGDLALAAGRLGEAEQVAGLVGRGVAVRPEFVVRGEALLAAVVEQQRRAEALVADGERQLAARDAAEAERLAEQASLLWADGPAVRAFGQRLAEVRRQSAALQRVESLTAEADYLGAQRGLADLAGSPLLRTRIYDMRQNLVRAQGLEGAFLLRVDEGGEHLVLRGETVTIGNVRKGTADLPVLANLAGQHASIRRSMSFHGGMQDHVVAEQGEVRVGGAVVTRHRLQGGDRIQLGGALALLYQQPTSRSLSVGLVLQGGFSVAGTDRVLLMKDRGRDGRLLIGPGRDVHVRVTGATGEIEVYANPSGQMRVVAEAGAIDGVPFRGDHPVGAGQIVAAAGISFVLLPWRPGS